MTKEKISKLLNIHGLFKSLSSAFIGIFVPLLILNEMGYNFAILYVLLLPISNFSAQLIFRKLIKTKPIMCISLEIFFSISSYIIIAVVGINLFTVISCGILTGIGVAIYYSPLNAIISSNNSKKGFSSFTTWQLMGNIAVILLTGYILNIDGKYSVLITCLISLVLYLISIIPFALIKNHIKLKKQKNKFKDALPIVKPFYLFNIVYGLQDLIVGSFFPIYLALNEVSLGNIGIALAAINLIRILITKMTNHMYYKRKSMLAITLGSILFILVCASMLFTSNPTILYFLTIIGGLSFPIFNITSCNEYQKKSRGFESDAMIIRELTLYCCKPLLIIPFFFLDIKYVVYIGIVLGILLPFAGKRMFPNPVVKIDTQVDTQKDTQK